jgi:plastocyanin
MRRRTLLLTAALAGTALLSGAVAAQAGQTRTYYKTALVRDYFYSPRTVTVKPNTWVTWRWPSYGGDSHDVYSRRVPPRVPKFKSELASTGYTFRRKLVRVGNYYIVCTLHPQMQQTIRVRP